MLNLLNKGDVVMKGFVVSSLFVLGWSFSAVAQDAPKFFQDTYPEQALQAALETMGALEGEGAVLDPKTRELVSLGVAAQIPCAYCIHAHTAKARSLGASEAEIREAVAAAAQTRHWSTVLNGMQYDLQAFKDEYDQLTQQTN
jgi:AhpD family alkylhydroperoxidase